MAPETEAILVWTAYPDDTSADEAARGLVEARLAACVTRLPGRSCYFWEGKLEQSAEVVLMIKTARARFESLRAWIRDHHPYDLPEVLATPVCAGEERYLRWLSNSVAPSSEG